MLFHCCSRLSSCCIIEVTTNIHIPGESCCTNIFKSSLEIVALSVVKSAHSNSDDNMLKNIELFDKLSLRFNGRVLFIKDVIGDEICCWSFYGQGRKIAEVCCTSIVYATEKKQTKVYVSGRAMIHSLCFGLSVKTTRLPLVGGVPRGPNLWGDPEYTPLWVPRWEGSRQRLAGGYRGCSRTISSPRWGWRARANRASS